MSPVQPSRNLPLDLHSREFLEDPAPTLAWLRDNDPVHRSEYGYWLLTRYDDVAAAFRDPRLSSDWAKRSSLNGVVSKSRTDDDAFTRAQRVVLHSFNMKDPPAHTRIRQLVQQAFTRAAIAEQRGRITELVDELIDAGLAKGCIDLVTELAFPLTITIASEMIGIPADARDEFRSSFEDTERLGDPTASPQQRQASRAALVWQVQFITGVVNDRRTEPRNDLVSALVQAEELGEKLTGDEIVAALLTLYTAGGTTTERMVSSGLLLLLQHPEQLLQLRNDTEMLGGAVTEILRYHHPNQQTSTARVTLEPIEIGGRAIEIGQTVRLGTGAANRDPTRWPAPDKFDITRPEIVSLALGQGVHYCIGAPLARLQTQIAISRLLQRCPDIHLVAGEVRHDPRRMDRYERIDVNIAGN
ncbi:MAG: cytochrome P450 [Ilumatobacteraceae bacterium]